MAVLTYKDPRWKVIYRLTFQTTKDAFGAPRIVIYDNRDGIKHHFADLTTSLGLEKPKHPDGVFLDIGDLSEDFLRFLENNDLIKRTNEFLKKAGHLFQVAVVNYEHLNQFTNPDKPYDYGQTDLYR